MSGHSEIVVPRYMSYHQSSAIGDEIHHLRGNPRASRHHGMVDECHHLWNIGRMSVAQYICSSEMEYITEPYTRPYIIGMVGNNGSTLPTFGNIDCDM